MKKVRMFLSAAAVIAIVGSTLAFTHKSGPTFCYADANSQFCPNQGSFNENGSTHFAIAPVPAGGCTSSTACTQEDVLLDQE